MYTSLTTGNLDTIGSGQDGIDKIILGWFGKTNQYIVTFQD